jgi:hypothetical protein
MPPRLVLCSRKRWWDGGLLISCARETRTHGESYERTAGGARLTRAVGDQSAAVPEGRISQLGGTIECSLDGRSWTSIGAILRGEKRASLEGPFQA